MVPTHAPDWMKTLELPGTHLHQFGRMLEIEETACVNRRHHRRQPEVIQELQAKAMTDGRYLIGLPLELPIEANINLSLAYIKRRFLAQDLNRPEFAGDRLV
jgi:hypothetical protein